MTRMMMDRAEQQIDRLEDKIHAVLDTEVLHRRGSNSRTEGGRGGTDAAKSGKDHDDPSLSWPKWTLPDIVEGGDDGLCDVAVETLSSCLHPILEGLADLDAEVLLELRRKQPQPSYRAGGGDGGGPVVREGVAVRPIHDDIVPPSHDPGAVRYLHLSEMEGQYSMGIFVFPPHARIPLHDHPGMCVLSRILYGDVHRLQLDLDREQPDSHTQQQQQQQQQQQPLSAFDTFPLSVAKDDIGHQHNQSHFSISSIGNFFRGRVTPPDEGTSPKQQSSSSSPLPYDGSAMANGQNRQRISPPPPPQMRHAIPPAPGAKRAYRRHVDHLRAPQTTILYPYEGNLHEFVAGPNGAAVLDVLLPPYDMHHHRDCTFYEIYDDDDDEDDDDMMMSEEDHEHSDGRVPCWIVPTGQPEDFHCISGRYRNLGTD